MAFRTFILAAAMLAFFADCPHGARAQDLPPRAAPTTIIGVSDLPAMTPPTLDPARATAGYLARVSGTARARSDAYFEGGYDLRFFDLVYAVVVAGLLLWLRVSTAIRDFAAAQTHSRFWQAPIYVALLAGIVALLAFPPALYEGFLREHSYGFSNQSFLAWFTGYLAICAVLCVGAMLVLTPIYAIMRRDRQTWWIWGAGIAILFGILVTIAYPGFIAPLFGHYTPLPEGALKQDIVSLARANGVPAASLYEVDESRRSTRLGSGVAGFLGTTRISLSDNLLREGTHDEVMAAAGREIGHYAMGHVARLILLDGLVILIGFAFIDWAFALLTDFFGGSWGVRRIEDPAGLPVAAALGCLYLFAMMPVTNTIERTTDIQADLFSINAVRKPDALATLTLKRSPYRKLDPASWEETVFYSHPSGRTRIFEAMRWKAEHMGDPDILSGPASPQ